MTKKYSFTVNGKDKSDQGVKQNSGFLHCRTKVDRGAITRQSIDGIEHIIIKSSTLPDDIVMNGKLYPASVIAESYETLELTFAPVEHPTINGQEVSAYDPRTMHSFYAGAYNMNVTRKNGRVWVDKYINVQEALKSEKGKRLLDRVDEMENNSNPRPIHTSVGVFFYSKLLDEPQVNKKDGREYSEIIESMMIDHDAILLDSEGAANPGDGVGLAINKDGKEHQIYNFDIDSSIVGNQDISHDEIHRAVWVTLEQTIQGFDWIEKLYDDYVIYEADTDLYKVFYTLDDDGDAVINGTPVKVTKETNYIQANKQNEVLSMKKMIVNALKKKGVDIAGMTDEQLFAAYNTMVADNSSNDENDDKGDKGDQADQNSDDQNQGGDSQNDNDDQGNGDNDVAAIIANALKPLTSKIDGLESRLKEGENNEVEKLAKIISNSDKYPGMDVDALKKIDIDTLKGMAANCQTGFGILPTMQGNADTVVDMFQAPKDMVK